jgi:hypothetical protein
MDLPGKIERAFAWREKPAEVVEPEEHIQFDSDVEESIWFAGRDWRDITRRDWQEHPEALGFFSRDALAYYLPSVLLLSLQCPQERLVSAASLVGMLDWSPNAECWTDHFRMRFLGLRSEEYDVIKEWLLYISDFEIYRVYGKSGPGDIFGRAFDTINLLQRETERMPGSHLRPFRLRLIQHPAKRHASHGNE